MRDRQGKGNKETRGGIKQQGRSRGGRKENRGTRRKERVDERILLHN